MKSLLLLWLSPQLLQQACDTDIVGLDLVDSIRGDSGTKGQQPHGVVVLLPVHSGWDVVNDTGLEANPGVCEYEGCKGGIENWSKRASDEWNSGQRNHADGNHFLSAPMERAMAVGWLWPNVRIVNGTNNVTWRLWVVLEEWDIHLA